MSTNPFVFDILPSIICPTCRHSMKRSTANDNAVECENCGRTGDARKMCLLENHTRNDERETVTCNHGTTLGRNQAREILGLPK